MLRPFEETPVTGIRAILGYVGIVCMLIGLLALAPLFSLLRYTGESVYAPSFIFPGIACITCGYLLYFTTIRGCGKVELRRRDGAAVVCCAWACAIAAYAAPFALGNQLDVSQAVFEATSGLTTTGLSVVDVTACPTIFLIHRTLMHYIGGIGLLLVLTCIVNDTQGLSIYHAEGHTDRLLPSSVRTARAVLAMYTLVIVAGICGMPLLDAFATSVSAVSTGGFVVDADSIGGYHSLAIEIVSIVLMLVGATNFLQNFLIVHGRFSEAFHHEETRAWYLTIATVSLIGMFVLLATGYADAWGDALRISLFQTVSVITTTGVQTIPSFAALPSTLVFLLVLLMFVGSEAGSTAGGMKMYRVVVREALCRWLNRNLVTGAESVPARSSALARSWSALPRSAATSPYSLGCTSARLSSPPLYSPWPAARLAMRCLSLPPASETWESALASSRSRRLISYSGRALWECSSGASRSCLCS